MQGRIISQSLGCQSGKNSSLPPMYYSAENLRSDTFDILKYTINLEIGNFTNKQIIGNTAIRFAPKMNNRTFIRTDLLKLTVDSIKEGNSLLTYNYNDTVIKINFISPKGVADTSTITVYYKGQPKSDLSWGGFYFDNTGGAEYAYNLGVGFSAKPHNFGRVWFPCFDNFVEHSKYEFNITCDTARKAYCNGQLMNDVVNGAKRTRTWVMNEQIPTYLANVSVAKYKQVNWTVNTLTGPKPITLVGVAGDTAAMKAGFINLTNCIAGFENYFGPYKWNRFGYCLVPFNSGAMEHATNISYPRAFIGVLAYESVLMAHELSHHWWGDLVTCETAEEMWINEGMARYAEHLFTEALYGYEEYMEAMRSNHYDVLHKAHVNDSGYYALNAVPIKFTYGDHSYNKGADVMHTLRSYMGDTSFFNALQSIQTTFAGQNISSEEFMNHINSVSSIDVTDFFNAWIFQPGFANFSITHLTILPSGSDFLVKVVVAQKLKGGAAYHENVPLQLTFMDENWNVNTQEIILPGHYAEFSFTLPFNPVFAGVNLNEKINDATTAITETITAERTYLLNYANTRLVVSNLSDSAFLRIEHCWVYPDMMNVPDNIQISRERYWNIHGVDLENIEGNLRFEFNGKTIISGNFDNHLLVDLGDQPFIEDSLVLLYRPTAQSSWQVHTDYTLQFTGSHTDKFGYITAETFAPGQYAFGYRTHSVGIQNNEKNDRLYAVYPNPANDSMIIDLSDWDSKPLQLTIFGIEGKMAMQQVIQSGQKNLIDISMLNAGTYIITISDFSGMVFGSRRIVVEN